MKQAAQFFKYYVRENENLLTAKLVIVFLVWFYLLFEIIFCLLIMNFSFLASIWTSFVSNRSLSLTSNSITMRCTWWIDILVRWTFFTRGGMLSWHTHPGRNTMLIVSKLYVCIQKYFFVLCHHNVSRLFLDPIYLSVSFCPLIYLGKMDGVTYEGGLWDSSLQQA